MLRVFNEDSLVRIILLLKNVIRNASPNSSLPLRRGIQSSIDIIVSFSTWVFWLDSAYN